jgi:hypothetical protein
VPDVFISYASKDRERVMAIVSVLERMRVDLWIDRKKIPGGATYGEEITKAIKECKTQILMCSAHFFNSSNCLKEVELAWHYQKHYLPLQLETVPVAERFLYWLEGTQSIPILDRPQDEWIDSIHEALSRLQVDCTRELSPEASRGRRSVAVAVNPLRQNSHLPYLANRSAQADGLQLALERHFGSSSKKPLVVLAHGDTNQSVDMWLERARYLDIPRGLGKLNLPDSVSWLNVPWPRSPADGPLRDETFSDRVNRLRMAVANALDLQLTSTPEAIRNEITRRGTAVVFNFHLGADLWSDDEAGLLRAWFAGWERFPELTSYQPVIILFSTKYPSETGGWLARRRTRKLNERARALFHEQSMTIASPSNVRLLPELADVLRDDAEFWVIDVVNPADPASMLRNVRSLYEDRSLTRVTGIPMEPLATRLRSFLDSGGSHQ